MMALALLAAAWAGARGRESAPDGPAGLDEAFAPRRVAVLIGVDEYDDPALGPLRFAAADAAAMAGVLGDPDQGAFDRIVTLDGEVSRAEIWQTLTEEGLRLRRDDTFVVFFAGHGT